MNLHCKNIQYATATAPVPAKPAQSAKKAAVADTEDTDTEETALNDDKEAH